MNRPRSRTLTPGLLAVALIVASCGGGSTSPAGYGPAATQTPESDLPAPPSGKATVGGTVTVNGEAVPDQKVSLNRQDGDKADAEVTTDPDGAFVFEAVEPGTYAIIVAVHVEDVQMEAGGFGLEWDTPCRVEGYAVLNSSVSDESTGASAGVIAAASNEGGEGRDDKPFEVEADERVEQDVEFVCETAA